MRHVRHIHRDDLMNPDPLSQTALIVGLLGIVILLITLVHSCVMMRGTAFREHSITFRNAPDASSVFSELACDALEESAKDRAVSSGFWLALPDAASKVHLDENAARYQSHAQKPGF